MEICLVCGNKFVFEFLAYITHQTDHHHKAAVINMITATHAVSVFPHHTFVQRLAIISSQGILFTDKISRKWLTEYPRNSFRVVYGNREVISSMRTGRRQVGDSSCWVIAFDNLDKGTSIIASYLRRTILTHTRAIGVAARPVSGPTFEVLDWRTSATIPGAYMRICDPFVWR